MPNANVLEAKKAIVAELTEKLQNAASGVLVDYKGITVAEEYTDTVKANTINASIALSPSRLRSSLTPRL